MNKAQLENLLIKHGFSEFQWLKPEMIHVYQWVWSILMVKNCLLSVNLHIIRQG